MIVKTMQPGAAGRPGDPATHGNVPQARAVRQRPGGAQGAGAGAAAGQRRLGDLLVNFEPGRRQLPGRQLAAIEAWAGRWLPEQPQRIVVLAHDVSAASETRLARLRQLRDAIERLGVSRENIKYTDLAVNSLPALAPGQRSVDAVMLRLIDPEAQATPASPVANGFDPALQRD